MTDDDRPLWQRLLVNRFTAVFGTIAVAVIAWNVYVSLNNNGVVAGRVVDASGRPVADATVELWVHNFTTFAEKERTRTGPDGHFRFTDNASHDIQLAAEKSGEGRSTRIPVRLYFRAQDVELKHPLVLTRGS